MHVSILLTPEDLKLGASKILEAQSNGEDLNCPSFGDMWRVICYFGG
jgi:hypothetical protein